jgi:lipopolysaccharide transport system ATP-binding protein
MSEIALEFDGVWKKFKRGEFHDSLRDLIPALTKTFFSRDGHGDLEEREFWALRDVSFQVRRGEAFGIIGANGAGKSTALKLLSRILRPNRGRITAHGRLSALIEVGAGFHPDLTGRENVYLNGSILGMKRKEIAGKFDEIVEFSGIGDFIDTPVKRYSSGMYARLGFAVAAHVDPEILLVDEVLSVGDMQFQEKCFDRMRRVVSSGTTVIFVSHNLQAVQMLCGRTLLLGGGKQVKLGETRSVLTRYVEMLQGGDDYCEGGNLISNVHLENGRGEVVDTLVPGERMSLSLTIAESVPLSECILVFIVCRTTDRRILCDYNLPLKDVCGAALPSEDRRVAISFDANFLRGAYSVLLSLYHAPSSTFLLHRKNVALFSVHETLSYGGEIHLNPELKAACSVPAGQSIRPPAPKKEGE